MARVNLLPSNGCYATWSRYWHHPQNI